MAGKKKQEIQLQREIETQEEWEECMAREGIWVVDVYQEWCGPCLALVTNFRRLKNELGDPLLNYAIAKADTIDALEKYRGRCEPTFLFYAGGVLVSFIHGANAPKIQRTITEQLAQEHKVLEGQAERKEVKDQVMTRAAEKEIAAKEAEQVERELEGGYRAPSADGGDVGDGGEPKGITVAIIKPDVVAAGKVDEIIHEINEQGIEILANEEKELTEEEAAELYKDLEDEKYFNDLIKFVASGPCRILVLTKGTTGQSVVSDWRELIGPTNVEAAKEEAPDSLRAKYGDQGYVNALHGSSSSEAAARELAFFFPQMAIPTFKKKRENIQRTLAIIRPEAFNEKKDEILAKISEAGFKIALYKEIELTKEQAEEFYKEHEGQSYFDQLVEAMTSGPVLALCLAGDEAIGGWRDMLGPQNVDDAIESAPRSLRANYTGASGVNQFHGSDNEDKAKKELNFFFPMEETIAVIKPSGMGTKDAIVEKIHEAGFRIAARKETTITQDIAEILYPQHDDKEYYDDLVQSMTSGPTMFMVLTREDAVYGWRQAIGDTNPEEAKAKDPTSIRAQFGQDILNNAVHGSSTKEQAREAMKAVFGNLEFNDDGTIKGQEPELEEATEALKIDRVSPVAETAPEYKDGEGDTTADTTADTTQDVTADTTQDQTQDQTMDQTADQTADQTQEPATTAGDETTVAETTTADETTADQTTADETTADETTEAETTAGDTTVADTTVDETQGDVTQADETQADATQGDTTTAAAGDDVTQDEPTATATEPDTTAGDTTAGDTTAGDTTAGTEDNTKTGGEAPPAADDAAGSVKGGGDEEKKAEEEEKPAEEPAVTKGGEEPKAEEEQKEGEAKTETETETKEETKQEDGKEESSEKKEEENTKGDATTTDQPTTES